MIGNSLLYPAMAALVGVAFLIIVPKEKYKHFLLWGLIFGGLGDAAVAALLVLLKMIEYKNMGPFNILNLFSFFTPITWAFVFALFFFLLPRRTVFLVPYILLFVGVNYSNGLVLEQLDLFRYIGIQRYTSIITFLIWYGVSALVYRKYGEVFVNSPGDAAGHGKNNKPRIYRLKREDRKPAEGREKTQMIRPKKLR